MTDAHVKKPDVPDVLYKGFDEVEHARAFITEGVIRFGRLESYRNSEDARRRDENEGKALLHTPVIPENWGTLNRVYVFCCSADLAFVASKFSYRVRINNPEELIHDVRHHVSSHPVVPDAKVYAKWVSYDRGATVPRPPGVDEWVDIAYSQKSACFAIQCEYRIAILSRPFADPIDAVFVKLNRPLAYCDWLGD